MYDITTSILFKRYAVLQVWCIQLIVATLGTQTMVNSGLIGIPLKPRHLYLIAILHYCHSRLNP